MPGVAVSPVGIGRVEHIAGSVGLLIHYSRLVITLLRQLQLKQFVPVLLKEEICYMVVGDGLNLTGFWSPESG